ncbi:hypothetical protein Tco_0877832 [Tanacetum coccineum]|uniref:Reverse transcriptase domain-containing protein n=1 Tax=Tanacetum coccineum TaxID=301880 RepID=A0ABQ5BYX4_9ASTR
MLFSMRVVKSITPLREIFSKIKIFSKFDEFMAMNIEENSESDSDEEEIPFEKITFDIDYKIKKSLDEPPTDLKLKLLPDHIEYVFLEEPSFGAMIISSQLSEQNKKFVEVFMEDFSVFRNSFDNCLNNLNKMLQRCKDANLVLIWKNFTSWLKKESFLDTKCPEQA